MSAEIRPWYRQPWKVAVAAAFIVCMLGMVLFGVQVVRYARLIQNGSLDPKTGLHNATFQASISSHFANANVTAADLARLEPGAATPSLGSPTASLRIVEFLDYGCPYCKSVSSVVHEFMAKHATDTLLIIRDFPITELHPDAEYAAMAANCVFRTAPQRYWLYHDRLFANQSAQGLEDLRVYAEQLGVNMTQYDSCMRLKTPMTEIEQSLRDGQAAGVQGTPTFFFNGVKISGALNASQLELIANEARAQKR